MNKMFIFLLFISAAIIFAFFWLIKDVFATENPLPVFKMSEKSVYNKLLLVRRTSPNGNLLLKILNEKTIIQYDTGRKSVSKVDEQVWHNATERISVCRSTQGMSEENEVGKYNTYGKYALVAADSPNKTKTAVVSAYGPKVPNISLIPFFGGGYRILGQRYLEIKENSANYPTIEKPFRVHKMILPQLCWTEDENIVVLFDSLDYEFSVLDLNPQQPPAQIAPNPPKKESPPKPDLSRLTGVVRDYGVDENADGFFEKIAVEVETETSVAGKYKFWVGLKSSNDKHFLEIADVELKGGIETTKFLFETETWFDEQIDGALKYDLIDLQYDHILLDRRQDSGQTSQYKLSQFRRPNIVYTGENKVTPIDKNRNGKYEKLQIDVGIDVLYPGDYEFQGDLYDELTNVTAEGAIEFGGGRANLSKGKGTITFFFSGRKIIEHGVSGRFRLRNVVIYKKGARGDYKENLLSTEPFDVKRFESEN